MKAYVHIKFSKNNIIINLTDENGNCIKCISSGVIGFKGAKKVSETAKQRLAKIIVNKLIENRVNEMIVIIKGSNSNITEFIEEFKKQEIAVLKIINKTTSG